MNMENNNSSIYGDYNQSTNNQISSNINNQVSNNINNQVNQLNEQHPKHKKVLKIVMLVSLISAILLIGGFTLVYTGVIKIGYVAPESILLNVNNIGLKKGKYFQYDYQVYPQSSTAKNVYYESSNPDIATVNELTGYITPISEGTVKITVKSKEDDTVIESSDVSITNTNIPITSIKLSSERIVFDLSNKNTSQLLKVGFEPYNATTAQNITFSSSDENVAIVDQTGRVFPTGFGMTTIIVSSNDSDVVGKCEVIVTDSENKRVYFELPDKKKLVFPYAIQLDRTYLRLKYGEIRKVGFTLLPPDVTEDVVTWISSNPDVATVKEGVIEGIAVGQTIITARTVNDLVATLTVDVTDEEIKPQTVEFSTKTEDLSVGDRKMIPQIYDSNATVAAVNWESSTPDVVSVNSNGVITALNPGTATIIATTESGNTAKLNITVSDSNLGKERFLDVVNSNISLGRGESKTINVSSNYNEKQLIYSSNNPDIVTVNDRGMIYGNKIGSALITISTVDGLNSTVNVTVSNIEPSKISIAAINQIEVGETAELITEIYPNNSTNKNITWKSSNNNILKVSDGLIRGVSAGHATITASIGDLKNTLEIDVVNRNESNKNEDLNTNATLNESELEALKKLQLVQDETYQEKNKLRFNLELSKYGFSEYVDLEKTTFEIDEESIAKTIKNVEIVSREELEKAKEELPYDSFYLTYKGYGDFEVKTTLTLKSGEIVELEPTKITIHPQDGDLNNSSGSSGGSSSNKTKSYTTSSSLKINKGATSTIEFSNYQEVAKKVTNWTSSDSKVATAESSDDLVSITGNEVGTATITGSKQIDSNIYKFYIDISVVDDNNKTIEKNVGTTLNYGECYSLCSNGELIESDIKKNASKCTASKPYYIDSLNKEYHYTCKNGNVITKYTAKSGSGFVNDAELKFNIASNTSFNTGSTLTITITNWDALGLESITYKAPNSNRTTIKSNSFSVKLPNKSGSYQINFSNGKGRGNRIFSGNLVLNVVEPSEVKTLACPNKIDIMENETIDLSSISCDVIYTNNTRARLENPEFSLSNGGGAIVLKGTTLKGERAGQGTLLVSGENHKAYIKVDVASNPIYTKLSLKLNKNNTSSLSNQIAIDEEMTVSYTLSGKGVEATSGISINWSSTNGLLYQGYDKASGTASFRAIATGHQTIKASYTNAKGETINNSITVNIVEKGQLTAKITEINCEDVTLNEGDSTPLSCTAYDETNDTDIDIDSKYYKVKNTEIAAIESNMIKAYTKGTTTVEVEAYNKKATFTITVNEGTPVYDSIKLTLNKANSSSRNELAQDEVASIGYIATGKSGSTTSGLDVNYTINTYSVITFISDNEIKAMYPGKVIITATYINTKGQKKTATLGLEVVEKGNLTANITQIGCGDLTLNVGDKGKLSCKKLDSVNRNFTDLTDAEYSSYDKSIIDIATDGTITAKKAGKTSITTTSKSCKKTTTSMVTVVGNTEPNYDSLSLTVAKTNIEVGQTVSLKYTAKDSSTGKTTSKDLPVEYHTDKNNIVWIAGNEITGMSESGNNGVRITATYKNLQASVYVRVVSTLEEKITQIGCGDLILNVGEQGKLSCKKLDANHDKFLEITKADKYQSSNTKVATVDASGNVVAKKAGKVTITTTANGLKSTSNVTVKDSSIKSVSLSVGAKKIKNGSTTKVSYTLKTKDGSTITSDQHVTITSSNTSVISVSGSTLTAKKSGSSKIKAVYNNGSKVTSKAITVTVYELKQCYRYKAVSTSLKACPRGYATLSSKDSTCYALVNGVYSSLVCGYNVSSGKAVKISGRKWQNNLCYNLNKSVKRGTGEKVTAPSYSYTKSKKVAQKGEFTASKDTLQCKGECSKSACS